MNTLPDAYAQQIDWTITKKSISTLFKVSASGEVPVFSNNTMFALKTSENYRFHKDQLRGLFAFLYSASQGDALLVHGPFGAGKTSFLREALGRLKWPALMLSWSEKSDSFELDWTPRHPIWGYSFRLWPTGPGDEAGTGVGDQ